MPSVSTAETKSSPPKTFIYSREVAVDMQVCLLTDVTALNKEGYEDNHTILNQMIF